MARVPDPSSSEQSRQSQATAATVQPLVRFSTLYLQQGKPVQDSGRARKRLQKYYLDIIDQASEYTFEEYISYIGKRIELECGIDLPRRQEGYFDVDHNKLFCQCSLIVLLDIVTVIYTEMPDDHLYDKERQISCKEAWLQICRIIFTEENLGYTIDDQGVVHYAVDEEFARNRDSALASLSMKEFAAVRSEADQAFAAIHRVPPDPKTACRHMFEAVEILFRKILPGVSRLGDKPAREQLLPLLRRMYADNQPAINSMNNLTKEIGDWANWLHIYRHGQRVEEPSPPPLEVAVLGVSTGASYLRFLADVYVWQAGASASNEGSP